MSKSAFEELLETFSTAEDRKAFEDLSAKNPKVKEYGLRQSDYSKRMDEVRDKISELEVWKEWRATHWDDEAKMTKREKEKIATLEALQQENLELEAKLQAGLTGEDMTLEQLESWGKDYLSKNGVVTQKGLEDTVKAKTGELEEYVKSVNQFTAAAALEVPYLNQKHEKEFGEPFDPAEFVKEAVGKNRYDLRAFYEEKVAPKRTDKMKADYEAKNQQLQVDADKRVEDAKRTAKEEGERLRAMGPQGQNPADLDSPTMGPLQRKMLKVDAEGEASKAPDVPLGEGGIAAFAAREFVQKQAGR